MPEVGDYSRHLQGVDTRLQRSSTQGFASGCFCGYSDSGIYGRNCSSCHELIQDVKPDQKPSLQLLNLQWKSAAEIPLAPAPTPAAPVATGVAIPLGSSSLTRVTRPRSSASADREHQARPSARTVVSPSPSPYLHGHGQRGRPPNGSRKGPVGFRGVRQRKNVRGFLVEIRPPKWKKTIWLGTYNSDREAAGAYDAGIFYTNKKTRYNFPALEGTFPPLPAFLRLDNADHSDQIKLFVQHEAREAAVKVRGFPVLPTEPNAIDTTHTVDNSSGGESSSNMQVSSVTSCSEDSASEEMGLSTPAEDDGWFNLEMEQMEQIMVAPAFADYTGWAVYDPKEEELDFEPVFVHSSLL